MSEVIVVSKDELKQLIKEAVAEAVPEQTTQPEKVWYTLREAAELKGISFDVLRKRPRWTWPNFGMSTTMIDGSRKYREVYHRGHVLRWINQTEAEIAEHYRDYLYEESRMSEKKKARGGNLGPEALGVTGQE